MGYRRCASRCGTRNSAAWCDSRTSPRGAPHEAGQHRNGRGRGRSPAERDVSRRRSEEHTSELQSPCNLVCRLLLEKKKRRPAPVIARGTTDVTATATTQPV